SMFVIGKNTWTSCNCAKRTQFFSIHRMACQTMAERMPRLSALKLIAARFAQTLVVRVEAGEGLPRQETPAPLPRLKVPTNVAVAVCPLQNDAKSVTEKVKVGRAAWKARVDDVDGIGLDIVLQTRPRVLTGAAAQHQKCHKDCCCAAHRSALPAWSRLDV